MMMNTLTHGMSIGFLIGIGSAPMGILCMQRAIAYGFLVGFSTGLGTAIADACYAAIAACGISMIADFILPHMFLLRLVGGACLIYIGCTVFYSQRYVGLTNHVHRMGMVRSFTSALFLTFSNPLTILLFVALLTAWDLEYVGDDISLAATFIGGIFMGSTLWWLILAGFSNRIGTRLSVNLFKRINQIAGVMIALFGLVMISGLLNKFLDLSMFE
jgi:threonine/homoserine/homoserine lactone efflux protein